MHHFSPWLHQRNDHDRAPVQGREKGSTLGREVPGCQASVVTAPALILVGLLMLKAEGIRWSDTTEVAPAFFTLLPFILRYALLPA